MIQAQQGSTHIWIPKKITNAIDPPQPRKQTPKRRKAHQKSDKARSNKQTNTAKGCQQVWVPKKLLSAQPSNKYKWIPKTALCPHQSPIGPTTQEQPRKPKPKPTHPQRWIPMRSLQAQGFYQQTTHIWVRKQKTNGTISLTEETPRLNKQAKQRWVQKDKQGTAKETKKQPCPEPPTKPTTIVSKATAQEKGKWIPKEQYKPERSFKEELPSTSKEKTTISHNPGQTQSPDSNKTSPLEAARHFSNLLQTFNTKTVEERWRRFMSDIIG